MEEHLPGGVGCGEDPDGGVPALGLLVEADGEGGSWERGVGDGGVSGRKKERNGNEAEVLPWRERGKQVRRERINWGLIRDVEKEDRRLAISLSQVRFLPPCLPITSLLVNTINMRSHIVWRTTVTRTPLTLTPKKT